MKKTWLFLALSCVSIAANATETNGLGYSHAELDYRYDHSSIADYKGPGISGSIELGNGFFATGNYDRQKINHFGGHNELSEWSLGGGYAMALGENMDWVSQAAYVQQDTNLSLVQFQAADAPTRVKDEVSGFRVSSGVRGRLANNLIGHAYLGYQDLGNISNELGSFKLDGEVFADLGLEYHFTDHWAATTRANFSDGISEYAAGVRLSF